jgi:hypothetical protein
MIFHCLSKAICVIIVSRLIPGDVRRMLPKFRPPQRMSWDIVRAGARIEFLGGVEATDERDAIEKAAEKFKTDPNKLLAVKRS